MTDKIAIIGDIDTVVGFRLAGILKSDIPTDPASTRRALLDFSRDSDVSIIIITEPLAEDIRENIDELSQLFFNLFNHRRIGHGDDGNQ